MRIKEVEQQTGLTAKAIRLYESKGLLSVSREAENEYRDYTEADVTRLKIIALLREMDIPMKTIKQWTDGELSLQALMQAAAQSCREDSQASQEKSKLAEELGKLLESCSEEDLPEVAQDVAELQEALKIFRAEMRREGGNLVWPVWTSIIALGPVSFVIIYILQCQVERALLAFGLSILSLIFAVLAWNTYLKAPRKERERSGCLPNVCLGLVVLVLTFAMMIGLGVLQERLFVPSREAVWVSRDFKLVFVLELELLIAGLMLIKKGFQKLKLTKKRILALVLALLVFNGGLLYSFFTGISIAQESGITRYSVFSPQGKEIPFEDVVLVETGFQGKLFGFLTTGKTGSFYYKLHYADGTVEDWSDCQRAASQESWDWMYVIDGWLMDAGVAKEGSTENSQYCQMDQEYVDILIRVVENQSGNS